MRKTKNKKASCRCNRKINFNFIYLEIKMHSNISYGNTVETPDRNNGWMALDSWTQKFPYFPYSICILCNLSHIIFNGTCTDWCRAFPIFYRNFQYYERKNISLAWCFTLCFKIDFCLANFYGYFRLKNLVWGDFDNVLVCSKKPKLLIIVQKETKFMRKKTSSVLRIWLCSVFL